MEQETPEIAYQTDLLHDFPKTLPEGMAPPERGDNWNMERRRILGAEELLWNADQKLRESAANEKPLTDDGIRRMIVDLKDSIKILERVLTDRRR